MRISEVMGVVRRVMRELWLDALALLWPTQCVGCGSADRDCCDTCLGEIRRGRGSATWVLAPAGVTACVAGPYEGPLRALLVAYKHAGQTGFATELGARLSAPLSEAINLARGPAPPLLVTVPSRAARVRERGYRHVDLLVRAALRGLCRHAPSGAHASHAQRALFTPPGPPAPPAQPGRPGRPELPGLPKPSEPHAPPAPVLLPRALRALRGRTSQVGLSAADRRRNAALVRVGRAAASRLRGRQVILIDDVVTTGATTAAAAAALTHAGAEVIAIVALCAVERRSERHHAGRGDPHRETQRKPHREPHHDPHQQAHHDPHQEARHDPHQQARHDPHQQAHHDPHQQAHHDPHQEARHDPNREPHHEQHNDPHHDTRTRGAVAPETQAGSPRDESGCDPRREWQSTTQPE